MRIKLILLLLFFPFQLIAEEITLKPGCGADAEEWSQKLPLGKYSGDAFEISEYENYTVEKVAPNTKIIVHSEDGFKGQKAEFSGATLGQGNCINISFGVKSVKVVSATGDSTSAGAKVASAAAAGAGVDAHAHEARTKKPQSQIKYKVIRSKKDLRQGDYITIFSKEANAYCWNDTQNGGISCDLKEPNIAAHFQVHRKNASPHFSLVGFDILGSNAYDRYCGVPGSSKILKCTSAGSLYKEVKHVGYRVGGTCDKKAHYITFRPPRKVMSPVVRPKLEDMKLYCQRRCDEQPACIGVQVELGEACNINRNIAKRDATQYKCGCKIITKEYAGAGLKTENLYRTDGHLDSTLLLKTGVFVPGFPSYSDELKIKKIRSSQDAVSLSTNILSRPMYYDSEDKEEIVVEANANTNWRVHPQVGYAFNVMRHKHPIGAGGGKHLSMDVDQCEKECQNDHTCLGFFHSVQKGHHHCWTKTKMIGNMYMPNPVGDWYQKEYTFQEGVVGAEIIPIASDKDNKYIKNGNVLTYIDLKGCRNLCVRNESCKAFISNGKYCALYSQILQGAEGDEAVYHPKAHVWGHGKNLKFYEKIDPQTPDFNQKKYQFVVRRVEGKSFDRKEDVKKSILDLKSRARVKMVVNKEGACHPSKVKDLYQYIKCMRFDPSKQITSPPSPRSKVSDIVAADIKSSDTMCTYVQEPAKSLEGMGAEDILLLDSGNTVYPGSIISANIRILTGDPAPLVVRAKRAPYKVSIEGMTGLTTTSIDVDPGQGDERAQITAGLNKAYNEVKETEGGATSNIHFFMKEANSVEEMATQIGVSVESPFVEAEASIGIKSSKESHTYIVKATQTYYSLKYLPDTNLMNIYPTVKKDKPEVWNDFIETVGSEGSAEPIAAVTNVTYGSMVVAIVKSSKSLSELNIDAKASGGAAGVKVGVTAKHDQSKSQDDTQMTLRGIGLPANAGKECVEGTGDIAILKSCIAKMIGFDPRNNPGVPLAYTIKYLGGRDLNGGTSLAGKRVAITQLTGPRLKRECQDKPSDMKNPCGQALLPKTCDFKPNYRAQKIKGGGSNVLARYKHKSWASNRKRCEKRCVDHKECAAWMTSWKKGKNDYGCWLYKKGAITPKSDAGTHQFVGVCNSIITNSHTPLNKKEVNKRPAMHWVDVNVDKNKHKFWSPACGACPAHLHQGGDCHRTRTVNKGGVTYRYLNGSPKGEKGCGFAKCKAHCRPGKVQKQDIRW